MFSGNQISCMDAQEPVHGTKQIQEELIFHLRFDLEEIMRFCFPIPKQSCTI